MTILLAMEMEGERLSYICTFFFLSFWYCYLLMASVAAVELLVGVEGGDGGGGRCMWTLYCVARLPHLSAVR